MIAKAKNIAKSQCSHFLINPDKGVLSETACILCKSARINELFNSFTSAGVSKMWYLVLTEAEKLGNEPMASASLLISSLLALRLNIVITDTSTGVGDLIGAEKGIRNSERGKK